MRAAKVKAAEHGESLKDLVTRAVAHEVDLRASRPRHPGRVRLPLVAPDAVPAIDVSNADIYTAFDDEDAERYGGR